MSENNFTVEEIDGSFKADALGLVACDTNREMAIFKLGKLVARQIDFERKHAQPSGPVAPEPQAQWMQLPYNSDHPDYKDFHVRDSWCEKAGCVRVCNPETVCCEAGRIDKPHACRKTNAATVNSEPIETQAVAPAGGETPEQIAKSYAMEYPLDACDMNLVTEYDCAQAIRLYAKPLRAQLALLESERDNAVALSETRRILLKAQNENSILLQKLWHEAEAAEASLRSAKAEEKLNLLTMLSRALNNNAGKNLRVAVTQIRNGLLESCAEAALSVPSAPTANNEGEPCI